MSDWDFILAPTSVQVTFELNEFMILWFDLNMLNSTDYLSGLGEWVMSTAQSMTPEQHRNNKLTLGALENYDYDKRPGDDKRFPDFVLELTQDAPEKLVASTLHELREQDGYPGDAAMLSSAEAFVSFWHNYVLQKYKDGQKDDFDFDADYYHYLYDMVTHPATMQETIIAHLQFMWKKYLQPEWERTRPMLREAVERFSQVDYGSMSAFEIIEAVTGRNLRGTSKRESELGQASAITFMPSVHIGPYVGFAPPTRASDGTITELLLYFRPRPAKNVGISSPALDRNELLVRLNALSDDTRLKMLELLTQHPELCAQDFITRLELSQSSASRHLRQLTASGYVSERRKDVAKCYSLNQDRIDDTIAALKAFLKK